MTTNLPRHHAFTLGTLQANIQVNSPDASLVADDLRHCLRTHSSGSATASFPSNMSTCDRTRIELEVEALRRLKGRIKRYSRRCCTWPQFAPSQLATDSNGPHRLKVAPAGRCRATFLPVAIAYVLAQQTIETLRCRSDELFTKFLELI